MTLDIRQQITYALVKHMPEGKIDFPALIAKVKQDLPTVTDDEIFDCFDDAADELDRRAEDGQKEVDAMQAVSALFDGMPEGTPLGECARIKADRGDPLAIAFLQWEIDQAGGVQ